ncbi:retropepsin-like domain-containing protein [Alloacidobacterium dinghuense]|uniref:Retropepsin-like domain-containing protein n=1 Tax=Alloacidobacterium dinghuense TaxID=2763107 RepID=A0A7G8BGP1_9BACT|nr:aspartyl protease family protein [Alloacidobacterium dinghuense]QNI31711.1 retropepsin-like domain-containing protein [Alloacidobacterium dinghuense]
MFNLKGFGCIVFAITAVATVTAETYCPGKVASVPYHLVNRHQMVVEVSINHGGRYSFLLDTGTQMTLIDPAIASSLQLPEYGNTKVASAGMSSSASFSKLALVETGLHKVTDLKVLVYDLSNLRATGLTIQGVLGEDFLEHFDVLIDNVHKLLCLDSSGAMRADVRGPHTALIIPSEITDGSPPPNLIIVEARLSDATRPVRLMLDSGANGAILFNTSEYLALRQTARLPGTGVDGRQRIFSVLPPQDVKIGSLRLPAVPVVSLAGTQKDPRGKGFDGVLTISLFRRVFIEYRDHFAVLDPL